MKFKLAMVAAASLMLLTACNNSPQSKDTSSKSSSRVTKVQARKYWTTSRSEKLADYMTALGKAQDTAYVSYTKKSTVTYDKVEYPQALENHDSTVDGNKRTFRWSTAGNGSAYYNVVAVYTDVKVAPQGNLYVFAFHKGKPVVLTPKTGGDTGKEIPLDIVKDDPIATAFTAIAKGKKAPAVPTASTSSSKSSAATSSSSTPAASSSAASSSAAASSAPAQSSSAAAASSTQQPVIANAQRAVELFAHAMAVMPGTLKATPVAGGWKVEPTVNPAPGFSGVVHPDGSITWQDGTTSSFAEVSKPDAAGEFH